MFKEKLGKVKELVVSEDGKNNKKKIENLVVFIIIIVITIIAINAIWSDNSKKSNKEENVIDSNKKLATTSTNQQQDQTNTMEQLKGNLETILTKINGVGKVNVLVTYTESSQLVAMYNENTKETSTEEKDTQGGTRLTKESDTQKDVIYQEENGEKKPITQKTIMPKIEGAIITAEGANDVNVKTNIIQAVEAVTGLATHKIQVFEMSK